ncbi:MAG: Na+/H+ antiporter NhaC family protein [Parasutterella sp.]
MLEVLTVGSFCASLFYCLFTGTSILYALIFAFFLFCGYALYRGFSLQEIGRACRQSIAKISNIIIVMLLIGALTASWRASGTIAYLVSYASEIISPSWSLLGTFILNAALSSLIGTSFGTAATMGVVTMSLCVGMGVSPFWAGGAALAGAYVGDRCSPVSTSAQLVCAVTGTELYKNIKNMLRTGFIPFLLACLIYFFVGNGQGAQAADIDLTKLFSQEYILSAWTLIPAIILLTMVMLKADIKLTMIASIASAFVTALFLRDLGSIELCKILFSGYQASSPEVGRLMNGGGVISMIQVCCIISISCTFAGILN